MTLNWELGKIFSIRFFVGFEPAIFYLKIKINFILQAVHNRSKGLKNFFNSQLNTISDLFYKFSLFEEIVKATKRNSSR